MYVMIYFGGEEGTGRFELAAGVWAGGRQPGSNAWRSLAVDQPCESRESPMMARREATHVGGGSQPDERHGLAAEVLRIDRRWKTRYEGFLNKYFQTRYILWSGDSIRVFNQPLP
jgi:hypothetical protein